LLLLLAPPLLWLGLIYLGSRSPPGPELLHVDESGVVKNSHRSTPIAVTVANFDVIARTTMIWRHVTLAAARSHSRWLTTWSVTPALQRPPCTCVMLPLWSSYLVRVYSWKLILAKEGTVSWIAKLKLTWLTMLAGAPGNRGPSPSISYIGTFWFFCTSGCRSRSCRRGCPERVPCITDGLGGSQK
jgi:putative spermidine/putrescine transport system permease protein